MSDKKMKKTKLSRAVEHIVKTADGRFKKVRLTRKLAMAAACTECMGFEENPAKCTATTCALFPYRAKTFVTRSGNISASELAKMRGKVSSAADG